MATKTITTVYDDIDGTEGAETVTFGYAGTSFEIDLADKMLRALEKALEPYIAASRSISTRATSSRSTSTRRAPSAGPPSKTGELTAMRAWARENGFAVSDRGRVAAEVQEAYRAAN